MTFVDQSQSSKALRDHWIQCFPVAVGEQKHKKIVWFSQTQRAIGMNKIKHDSLWINSETQIIFKVEFSL